MVIFFVYTNESMSYDCPACQLTCMLGKAKQICETVKTQGGGRTNTNMSVDILYCFMTVFILTMFE